MPLFWGTLDVRHRFIARRGLVPWGFAAGVIAATVAVSGLRHAGSEAAVVGVAAVCFLTWATLVTWAVGALLWELRQLPADTPGRGRPRGTR